MRRRNSFVSMPLEPVKTDCIVYSVNWVGSMEERAKAHNRYILVRQGAYIKTSKRALFRMHPKALIEL
jgi:hypothetical protein